MKKSSVPVQKGKINPTSPPPEKMKSRLYKDVEDASHDAMRKSGMTMRMHTPKR